MTGRRRARSARSCGETGVQLLLGSDQVERGRAAAYYNAAFMLRPDGATAAVYRKMHLVPFGEYVPLQRLLFFVGPLVEAVSDFTPGDGDGDAAASTGHDQHGHLLRGRLSGAHARRRSRQGSQLLTTITNDAWYGRLVGAVSALRAGVDARDRAGPLPGARRQHRHQRHRRSVRARRASQSALFETRVVVGEVRLLAGATVYAQNRRSGRLPLRGADARRGSWLAPCASDALTVTLEGGDRGHSHSTNSIRRYQDLVKRAGRSAEVSLRPHDPATS